MPEKRHITCDPLRAIPNIMLISDENKVVVGRALFLVDVNDSKKAILWDIFVKPSHRNKYFATHMLQAAKKIYEQILTDWTSDAGHDLCISNGFKSRKKELLRLVWVKEDKDAGNNDKGAGGISGKDAEHGAREENNTKESEVPKAAA